MNVCYLDGFMGLFRALGGEEKPNWSDMKEPDLRLCKQYFPFRGYFQNEENSQIFPWPSPGPYDYCFHKISPTPNYEMGNIVPKANGHLIWGLMVVLKLEEGDGTEERQHLKYPEIILHGVADKLRGK